MPKKLAIIKKRIGTSNRGILAKLSPLRFI